MKEMNIVSFKFGPGKGIFSGADVVPLQQFHGLRNIGIDCTLVTGLNLWTESNPWGGWGTYDLIKGLGSREFCFRYPSVSGILSKVEGENPRVVHTHTRASMFPNVIRTLKSRGAKFVHTAHGMDEVNDPRVRPMVELADLVTSPSAYSAEAIKRAYPQHASKIIPFPNSTDFVDYKEDPVVDAIAQNIKQGVVSNENQKIVLITGRLHHDKGVYEAGAAVAELVREGHNLLFLHAGMEYDGAQKLRDIFAVKGVQDNLCLYGMIDAVSNPKEMVALYKAADIFVMPSDTTNETFCLSALEALALGIPTIVSNIGATNELYVRPNLAKGVAPRNVDQLKVAIREVLDNYDVEKERAIRASGFVADKYSTAAVVEQLHQLYQRLLDN